MKKLYAVRDKSTGEFVKDNLGRVVASEHIISAPVSSRSREEIINLRIEPTEPCEWCETYGGEMIAPSDDLYAFECALDAEDWSFCPNCGRRLGDE